MVPVLRFILIAAFAVFMHDATAQPLAPDIVVTKVIDAPVAEVWKAWTTPEGIESFFAPKAAKVVPEPRAGPSSCGSVSTIPRASVAARAACSTASCRCGSSSSNGMRPRRCRRSASCVRSCTSISRRSTATGPR